VARLADGTTRRAEVSYQAKVVCGRISKLKKEMFCVRKTYTKLFNFSHVRKNVIYLPSKLKDEESVAILIHGSLQSGRALTGIPQLT